MALVVVNGAYSKNLVLTNMVYQGTVLGPPLWNSYFADARLVAEAEGLDDTFFADDLNLFRAFPTSTANDLITNSLEEGQAAVHTWGVKNQVQFDAGKESFHILHRRRPKGESFKIMGILWDTKLTMLAECQEVAARAGWKLKTLLRTRRFYTTSELVILYKSHVLPVLEFPTPAVFHAASSVFELLDKVQGRFLCEVGLTPEDVLLFFHLAPSCCRRDMAALGLIHRAALGLGPPHFLKWFFPCGRTATYQTRLQTMKHNKQLHEHTRGCHTELLKRSLLGQVVVYNKLPQAVVDASTVKVFQRRLQATLKQNMQRERRVDIYGYARFKRTPWQQTYSTRVG